MFRINRTRIEGETRSADAKRQRLHDNSTVLDAVKLLFVNIIDEIMKLPVYNAAHWVCNMDRWIDNLQSDNKTTYQRGEIVFLDLGAQNFKYEPSYTHACIVLANRSKSILIVPCSTKKFRSGYRDIIDATPANGFMRNTGIQSESFRWVNKNRVVSRTGKRVSSDILDRLDHVLVSFAPSHSREISRLNGEIQRLNQKIADLEEIVKTIGEVASENSVDNGDKPC
jgi:hypothetical protein